MTLPGCDADGLLTAVVALGVVLPVIVWAILRLDTYLVEKTERSRMRSELKKMLVLERIIAGGLGAPIDCIDVEPDDDASGDGYLVTHLITEEQWTIHYNPEPGQPDLGGLETVLSDDEIAEIKEVLTP